MIYVAYQNKAYELANSMNVRLLTMNGFYKIHK